MTEREATALLTHGDDAPDVFQDSITGAWIGRVRGRYLTRSEIRIELEHAQDDRVPHLRGALMLIEQAVKANAERLGFGRATPQKTTHATGTSRTDSKRNRPDDRRGGFRFDDDDSNVARLSDVRDERREASDDRTRVSTRTSASGNKAVRTARRNIRATVQRPKTHDVKVKRKRSTVAPKKTKRR